MDSNVVFLDFYFFNKNNQKKKKKEPLTLRTRGQKNHGPLPEFLVEFIDPERTDGRGGWVSLKKSPYKYI